MPEFSVVIPLFNKGMHIGRALDSVLSQTVKDIEIIVVDDGSIDHGAKIVKEYNDPRIILIEQDNHGVSAARNRGIKKATADLIAFLDADDEWLPVFLECILSLRRRFPQAGAYATGYIIHEKNRYSQAVLREVPDQPFEGLTPNYFVSASLGDPPICASAVCVPREIFQVLGGFPEGESKGEDLDMWGRIALRYPIAITTEIASLYHRESEAACRLHSAIHMAPFVKTVTDAHQKGDFSLDDYQGLQEYIAILEIGTASNNIYAGETKLARQILRRCKTKVHRKKKIAWYLYALLPIQFVHFIRSARSIHK